MMQHARWAGPRTFKAPSKHRWPFPEAAEMGGARRAVAASRCLGAPIVSLLSAPHVRRPNALIIAHLGPEGAAALLSAPPRQPSRAKPNAEFHNTAAGVSFFSPAQGLPSSPVPPIRGLGPTERVH